MRVQETEVDTMRVQETDMLAGIDVAWNFIWSNETAVDSMRVQETEVDTMRGQETDLLAGIDVAWNFIWSNETAYGHYYDQ